MSKRTHVQRESCNGSVPLPGWALDLEAAACSRQGAHSLPLALGRWLELELACTWRAWEGQGPHQQPATVGNILLPAARCFSSTPYTIQLHVQAAGAQSTARTQQSQPRHLPRMRATS